jgi:hypothetical protein
MKNSKKKRQLWWKRLSEGERANYVHQKQAQKAEKRAKFGFHREIKGFEKSGVNPKNQQKWVNLILRKNPWLNAEIFG